MYSSIQSLTAESQRPRISRSHILILVSASFVIIVVVFVLIIFSSTEEVNNKTKSLLLLFQSSPFKDIRPFSEESAVQKQDLPELHWNFEGKFSSSKVNGKLNMNLVDSFGTASMSLDKVKYLCISKQGTRRDDVEIGIVPDSRKDKPESQKEESRYTLVVEKYRGQLENNFQLQLAFDWDNNILYLTGKDKNIAIFQKPIALKAKKYRLFIKVSKNSTLQISISNSETQDS